MIHPKEIIQLIEDKGNCIIPFDVERDALSMIEEYRSDIVEEVKERLLKQLVNVSYPNGYPIQAVAKATILSLPALMGCIPKKKIK